MPSLRGIHVFLVVEDAESRELMKTVLEYAGALVSTVSAPRAALATLNAIRPDVVLADLGADGDAAVALIDQIHTLRGGARIPAIVVTARGGRDERERLLKAGFQQQLVKPLDPWELCRLVASLAARST